MDREADIASQGPLIDRGAFLPEAWWSISNDDQLNWFVIKALKNNPTLFSAREKVERAAALANLTRSSLFPDVNWGADVSRQKLSETGLIPFDLMDQFFAANTPMPATGGALGIPTYFSQYETEFTLRYDFDLWGKGRKAWIAALGEVNARIADEAEVRLLLSLSVANTYFQLQVAYKREEIAKRMVEIQEESFALLIKRQKNNLESNLRV